MNDSIEQAPQPFVSHLVELRNRVAWALGAVLFLFICLVPFAKELYAWFAAPLIANIPEGGSMIAIDPHATLFTTFKLAFAVAFGIAVPFVLYQAWAFVAPGLYKNEKNIVLPLVVSTTFLFYLGVLFAYAVVFPLIFRFFALMTPEGVAYMPDIASYMSFALSLFFAFGIAFEVPVAIVILTRMGVLTPETIAKNRGYFILGSFVMAMLMTPPDPFSQIMLAIPVCLLFEVGLFFAKRVKRNVIESESDPSKE